jgi:DNA-binding NtrC family response regulator
MGNAVLIIEDEARLARNIRAYLELHGFQAQASASAEEGLRLLERFSADGIVLDLQLPGMNGLEALARIRQLHPRAKTVMVTGHGSIEAAVEAMRTGAYDFLTKPVSLAKLKLLLEGALGEPERDGGRPHDARPERQGPGVLLGESEGMRAVRRRIQQVLEAERAVPDDPPAVLITGETGTGKELVAHALHYSGSRSAGPFVKLNCAALPAQLVESELFGHEPGAFTDARTRKPGLLEAAAGGTLFLDEVVELDLGAQAKLLRVLDEKVARRLGSIRDYPTSARTIAATNRPLEVEVQEGRFRADLYFRLRIVELHAPPLREREGDVLLLARHFLAVHGTRYGKRNLRMSEAVEQVFLGHRWPGNVRELRNVIEEVVLLTRHDIIQSEDLRLCTVLALPPEERAPAERCHVCSDFPCEGLRLQDVERDLLLKALRQTAWNVSRAARLLGISRDTLRYRMEKFGLSDE